jgi:hypothetical protein
MAPGAAVGVMNWPVGVNSGACAAVRPAKPTAPARISPTTPAHGVIASLSETSNAPTCTALTTVSCQPPAADAAKMIGEGCSTGAAIRV